MNEDTAPCVAGHAIQVHRSELERLAIESRRLGRRGDLLSASRLGVFLWGGAATVVAVQTAWQPWAAIQSICSVPMFVALVILHARTAWSARLCELRLEAHRRHLARSDGTWVDGVVPRMDACAPTHAYGHDIDLEGPGSLLHLIDVTRTRRGHDRLRGWLKAPTNSPEVLRKRQAAVAELSERPRWRVELEVASRGHVREERLLEAESFVRFVAMPSPLRSWHKLAVCTLLAASVVAVAGSLGQLWPWRVVALPLTLQGLLAASTWGSAWRYFNLLEARRAQLEGFARMLRVVETAEFRAPRLIELRARLGTDGMWPSRALGRLATLAGYADARMQVVVHPFLNVLLLWDLHVLWGLQHWVRRAGRHVDDWLDVIAEVEALASLASPHAVDPAYHFPEIVENEHLLAAQAMAHPLLAAGLRVANDVQVVGPGHVVVVSGSNMAGKSTFLRAVGLNIALALAGGAVCAERMRISIVRLRASMRASDSVQRGASYFYAELEKIEGVTRDLSTGPPVFFLLDELLRGTSARARTLGSAAIVRHLLFRGCMGLVATHDIGLTGLVSRAGSAEDVHFTDTLQDGEMSFDYRLRPGPAMSSNALQLLEMAGIASRI